MAKHRKIYVDAGDMVTVHVMGNNDVPKNHAEWMMSGNRPFRFSFCARQNSVVFSDPGIDIRRTNGGSPETCDGHKVEP